jgi:hypothetical protein
MKKGWSGETSSLLRQSSGLHEFRFGPALQNRMNIHFYQIYYFGVAWKYYYSNQFALAHWPNCSMVALILSVIQPEWTAGRPIPRFADFDVKHLPDS